MSAIEKLCANVHAMTHDVHAIDEDDIARIRALIEDARRENAALLARAEEAELERASFESQARTHIAKLDRGLLRHRERAERLDVPRWQPIETAPKDGTRILVRSEARRGAAEVHVAEWHRPHEYWLGNFTPVRVTHWMPLPCPKVHL